MTRFRALLCLALPLAAAEPKGAWLGKAEWIPDYGKAIAISRASGKPLLAYFMHSLPRGLSGKRLERGVFLSPLFSAWAKEAVLYYGPAADPGAPILAFLDSEGRPIACPPPDPSVEEIRDTAAKAKGLLALREKALAGDPAARFPLLEARAELGTIEAGELERELRDLAPLSKDEEAKADSLLVLLEVRAALASLEGAPAARMGVGRRFMEMAKAGRIPVGREKRTFWMLLMDAAEEGADADSYAAGLDALKGQDLPDRFFRSAQQTLERLRGKPLNAPSAPAPPAP